MKKYPIIHIKSPHPAFSWNDGLFAIISEEDGILNMCKINDSGQPQRFDDYRFMITCTGSKNPGITKTSLFLITKTN